MEFIFSLQYPILLNRQSHWLPKILKSNIMKRVSFFVVAVIALTISSCSKEIATTDQQALSQSAGSMTSTTSTPVTKLSLSKTSMNYGAWILSPYADTDTANYSFVTNVASELSLSCVRDITPVPGIKKVKTLTSQYNVLLNFLTTTPKPMLFRTDTAAYKNDLENVLANLSGTPAIAIIENEESNKGYYSGTPQDYINQLKAAVTVMHAHGIPVTNGGITSVGLKYLTYQDYLNRGMTAQAQDYAKRMHIALNNADTKDRANFISVLLAAYATMNLDYVNFHWRSQTPTDAQGLGETIDYLKRATGKTVITTEIGQYDQDPATLTSTVQMCKTYNFPYIIWYSGVQDGKSYPLQFNDQSLTSTGVSYKGLAITK